MSDTNRPQHIVELYAENVKKLRMVRIRPKGAMVLLKGKNKSGKSSALDTIRYLMGGKGEHAEEVIRRGSETALGQLTLTDYVVRVDWRKNKRGEEVADLTVTDRAGVPVKGGQQGQLNALKGSGLMFDPGAFILMKPKERAEAMRKAMGLDFRALDDQRATAFASRTGVNRSLDEASAKLRATPVEEGVPDEPVDVAKLLAEQEQLQAQKDRNDHVRRQAAAVGDGASLAAEKARRAGLEVARLEQALAAAKGEFEQAGAEAAKRKLAAEDADFEAAALTDPDFAGVRQRIADQSKTNEAVARKKARKQLAASVKGLESEAEAFTKTIAGIDASKAAQLAAAQFPVEGLGFNAEDVTVKGLPFDQASQAEQLEVAFALALLGCPQLRVALMSTASVFDEDALAVIEALCAKHNIDAWLERPTVDKDGPGIIFEDGEASGPEVVTEEADPVSAT